MNDAMFQRYDEGCANKVRGSFRLGGVFMGRVDDANRANSVAQYVSAETQVFRPERSEFDEIMNSTVMAEIAPAWKFVSNQQTFTDITARIMALGQLKGEVVRDEWVHSVATTAGLALDRSHALESAADKDNPPLDDEDFDPVLITRKAKEQKLKDGLPEAAMLRVLFGTNESGDIDYLNSLSDEDFDGQCKHCAGEVYQDEDMAPIVDQQVREKLRT